MKPWICICCGEVMGTREDPYSRDPSMCASCSSLWDGMPESSLSSFPELDDDRTLKVHFHKAAAESLIHEAA